MVCLYDHVSDDGDDSSAQKQLEHEVVEHLAEDLAKALWFDRWGLVAPEVSCTLFSVALIARNACLEARSQHLLKHFGSLGETPYSVRFPYTRGLPHSLSSCTSQRQLLTYGSLINSTRRPTDVKQSGDRGCLIGVVRWRFFLAHGTIYFILIMFGHSCSHPVF